MAVHSPVDIFEVIVCEFDLSSADAARIRRVLSWLGLEESAPEAVASVRTALREGGMAAFDLNFRSKLWGLRVWFDPSTEAVDTERASIELKEEFGVEQVEWVPHHGSGCIAAEFGFRCPESWTGVLPAALGQAIRRRVHSVVAEATIGRSSNLQ